jgi:hypothetical protein
MLICFAHTIFVAFACGEPILDAFDDPLLLVKTKCRRSQSYDF